MTEDERIEAINQLANGYGMSMLDMVDGDWELALSVTVTLLGSTLAQTSLARGEDVEELLSDSILAVSETTRAFHAKLSKPAEAVEKTDENTG